MCVCVCVCACVHVCVCVCVCACVHVCVCEGRPVYVSRKTVSEERTSLMEYSGGTFEVAINYN